MSTYRTRAGEMLDAICYQNYPNLKPSDSMPHVLDANHGLSEIGPKLPEGLIIQLPKIATEEPVATISLWD